jgi:lipopolysaccharide export system permease protein
MSQLATTSERLGWTAGATKRLRAGIPRLYAGRIVRSIAIQLVLMLLFIELLFLTEKLYYILRSAIDHRVPAADVFLLLLYTAPQISDLALPLALTIAVYRVALKCREDREFLVFAGMGIGIHQFIWLALIVGVGAQIASLFVSGLLDPRAQYAHRSVLFDAKHEAIRGGVTPGQFYFFDRYTVYAGRQEAKTPERGLFIHRNDGDTQRVIVAARSRVTEPDAEGRITLQLQDVVAQDFRLVGASPSASSAGAVPCDDCASQYLTEPTASMRIGKFSQSLTIDSLLRFDPRGRGPAEWTLAQLVGLSAAPYPIEVAHLSEAGRRFGRSLLCLIAPLIAGVALALTTRVTQAFALPLACAVVMCFDLGWSRLAGLLAPHGLPQMFFTLAVSVAIVSALLMLLVVRLQNAFVKPALARA